ncbi:MAG TPA: SDR family oxidoreductase [Solirubrobacteraceae bacterium]|jgi:NAD(P)-dependent dehydrogenase (short-subunit alcohol dehydrogenase family)
MTAPPTGAEPPVGRFVAQRALVTGASSGIGRAAARRLAGEGAEVVGLDTSGEGLEETFASIPGAHRLAADVSSEEALAAVRDCDVLVNAAGILERHDLLDHPLHVWQRTLQVNLTAPLRLSREFARARIQAGVPGAIVNVASIESFIALPRHAAYTASKSALLMLTRAFALELAPHGIRVNAVAPGVTKTGMNAAMRADPERAAELKEAIPLGRFATPEEPAAAICFLASSEAGYVTGATLRVDGGWLAR